MLSASLIQQEYLPATKAEYDLISTQLAYENMAGQAFHELDEEAQAKKIKDRLKIYSHKVRQCSQRPSSRRSQLEVVARP
jgi:hypothetical protein